MKRTADNHREWRVRGYTVRFGLVDEFIRVDSTDKYGKTYTIVTGYGWDVYRSFGKWRAGWHPRYQKEYGRKEVFESRVLATVLQHCRANPVPGCEYRILHDPVVGDILENPEAYIYG